MKKNVLLSGGLANDLADVLHRDWGGIVDVHQRERSNTQGAGHDEPTPLIDSEYAHCGCCHDQNYLNRPRRRGAEKIFNHGLHGLLG